jgi:oligopeptide/dipeptide ABC transporter ATP-binding protein
VPPLLEVRRLNIDFPAAALRAEQPGAAVPTRTLPAVRDLSFTIAPGEVLGLVGESGSGKSITSLAIMRLLPPQAKVSGEILFTENGSTRNLAGLSDDSMRELRGSRIAMIFQEPMTALNPVMRVGDQIAEAVRAHGSRSKHEAASLAVQAMTDVAIPQPDRRARDYPHQLSGGMRQRVMIAMALSCKPKLLIADEPTTALDVTIQAQILELLRKLQRETGMAILLITHDLGVVAENADVVNVMYASRIVETATVEDLFDHPMHPYTEGLFRSVPKLGDTSERLATIPGTVPNPANFPGGCKFHTRCPLTRQKAHGAAVGTQTITITSGDETFAVLKRCHDEEPQLREIQKEHWAACHQSAEYDKSPLTEPRLEHKREIVPQVIEGATP